MVFTCCKLQMTVFAGIVNDRLEIFWISTLTLAVDFLWDFTPISTTPGNTRRPPGKFEPVVASTINRFELFNFRHLTKPSTIALPFAGTC